MELDNFHLHDPTDGTITSVQAFQANEQRARNGNHPAEHIYAYCRHVGLHCTEDGRTAVTFYEDAIEGGVVEASYNLGLHLARGWGSRRKQNQDVNRARQYLQQAADHGIEHAREALEELNRIHPPSKL